MSKADYPNRWHILCADAVSRHLPYANFGDAECDAKVLTQDPARCGDGCPGGTHTVEPYTGGGPVLRGQA